MLNGVAQGWSAASGLMLLLVMLECNAALLLLLLMKSFLHMILTQASPGVYSHLILPSIICLGECHMFS